MAQNPKFRPKFSGEYENVVPNDIKNEIILNWNHDTSKRRNFGEIFKFLSEKEKEFNEKEKDDYLEVKTSKIKIIDQITQLREENIRLKKEEKEMKEKLEKQLHENDLEESQLRKMLLK